MRLIDADAEIAKMEKDLQKCKKRLKRFVDKNEPDNMHITSRIDQCRINMHEIKAEMALLRSLPTAYNIDKVIERLKKESLVRECDTGADVPTSKQVVILSEAIKAVRKGGVEE